MVSTAGSSPQQPHIPLPEGPLDTRASRLLATQGAVLESVATGVALPAVLDQLCELIERQSPGSLCSVLLLDPRTSTLRQGAAPSLPPEYAAALDGLTPGNSAGSCGTAAFRGEAVIVTDIQSDPLWDEFRELALRFGIRSCWSTPILASGNSVLGTFAISHETPAEPSEHHFELMRTAGHLAGIAIERERMLRAEEELSAEMQKRERLESLGVLAAGIAHDFNNLLTAVMGNLYLASASTEAPAVLEALGSAEEACLQSRSLTARFLAFSKGSEPVRQTVRVERAISDAAAMALAGANVRFECDWQKGLAAVEADPGRGRRVLLMEDDALVRSSTASILRSVGFRVDAAADGQDAIRQFRAAATEGMRFDAVVFDLTVHAGMGGVAAMEALRGEVPHLGAVVASGYSDDSVLANPAEFGFHVGVAKPYRLTELVAAIRSAIACAAD